jgi:hypothetical protein
MTLGVRSQVVFIEFDESNGGDMLRWNWVYAVSERLLLKVVDAGAEGGYDEWHRESDLGRRCVVVSEVSWLGVVPEVEGMCGFSGAAFMDPRASELAIGQLAEARIEQPVIQGATGLVLDVDYWSQSVGEQSAHGGIVRQ